MKSYHIVTYGCQMNKNDSERLAGLLENTGWDESPEWEKANLVILNTCSIRDKAERRVKGKFHELNHYRKTHNRNMKLAITGCMPQHARKFINSDLKFIDYVVGVNNMEMLPELLEANYSLDEQMDKMKRHRKHDEVVSYEDRLKVIKREPGKKAWVSIMFGCDKFCTYCIVPFTRGREFSRKKEDIFAEIAALEEKGYTEVVLLGQNVNSYGKTTYKDYLFPHLLEDIATKFPFLEKIDFLTSHPRDVDRDLIDVIAEHKNIHREIHFPLQHGDDTMLRRMNRQYSVAEYKDKVAYIREKMPDARIGTDLIVGFPGETEEQFTNMLNVLEEIEFDWGNTAAFSARPNTRAAKYPDQIDEETKNKRLNILNQRLKAIYSRKLAASA